MPPRAAPPAALLTSLTVRAGWVVPVTGMGQWGVGAKTRPQTPPPPPPPPGPGRQAVFTL